LAGRKTFTAGEVLQAADVNDFLMDQSVMVFAGTAARGSAIPSPSEGMVTYLEDADELQVYTTDWGAVGGGLVAVKHALKTDTFSASLANGADVEVTGLSITHAMADASNKLIISAYFGLAANGAGNGQTSLAIKDGSTKIAVGDAAGSRSRVGAGGVITTTSQTFIEQNIAVTFVYKPGDTASHTYTVRAINQAGFTETVYINRRENDTDILTVPRSASGFVIQEVSV